MRQLLALLLTSASWLIFQDARPQNAAQKVGPLSEGGFLLNSGWKIRPAGTQVEVGTFPMSTALSRDGKYLLVLNAGYDPPSISVISTSEKKEVGRTPLPDAWLGLAFDPGGDKIYVGGATRAVVYELSFNAESGAVSITREFPTLKMPNTEGQTFIGDVAVSSDGHMLYAADLYGDSVAAINLQSGTLVDRWKVGSRPYRIWVPPGNTQIIVSGWGDSTLHHLDTNSGQEIEKTRLAPHPTDIAFLNKPVPAEEGTASNFVGRAFVAAANTNNVYALGLTKDGQLTRLETINVSLTPMHPLGMTPSALAINQAGTRLYVVCSDANAVAEVDISAPRSRVLGFIPTAWYPTAVIATGTNSLAIVNGKGMGSHPNPNGPNPTKRPAQVHQESTTPQTAVEYVGHIQKGSVSFVPDADPEQLAQYSETVRKNSPYRDEVLYTPISDEQTAFFSRTNEHQPPIQHVIYVIKENRTYDQVLGDMEKGNGDKNLNLFGEQFTPNLHALARQYILYDNFYENSDVSADGHNWASAAIAPDFTMKLWPNEYGHRSKLYAFEGGEPANTPPAGYLWDNALQAGVSVRDYGQWTTNIPLKSVTSPRQIKTVKDPLLAPHVDMNYRGFDLEYSDIERAKEFIREWKEFDAKGQAPQLSIVRMGNDHTQGTKAGALTPLSYAADNDLGVGMLVEAVSNSKLWNSTAIFIIEDDAQNGPDHVDSHRAPAWVISPFTRRGSVDSTMYNQMSILRTMEMILGLRPMTHFDAGAQTMFATFSRQPDSQPYRVIPPRASLTNRNPGTAVGSTESARMDFSEADRIDDDELNAVLWRAIKNTEPPAPTRSAFAR